MITPKARRQDRPVFCPTDAVLNAHANRTKLLIESLLGFGEFLLSRFLEGPSHGYARQLLFDTGGEITHRDKTHLVGQPLITFVGIRFAMVR